MGGIPRTDELAAARLDELAAHFDSVDAGDLSWDEADDLGVERPEPTSIAARLSLAEWEALASRAAERRVSRATLVTSIIRGYLRQSPAR